MAISDGGGEKGSNGIKVVERGKGGRDEAKVFFQKPFLCNFPLNKEMFTVDQHFQSHQTPKNMENISR